MQLSGKRIVVTGGAGFLGSHLVDRLRQAGCEEVFVPRSRDFDLTEAAAVERLFETVRPDVVIHAAALCGGIGANRENPGEFFYVNAMMGIHIIEAARRHGVEKTVVLGTICAYPKHTPTPFSEDALWDGYPEETNAPYGLAKKMLLAQCQAYRQQYGMNAIYLLPVNLYGPRDNFDLETSHVIPALIHKCFDAVADKRREIVLWGDGSPTREFLYVEDAAAAIVAATEKYDEAEPVNIGAGMEISIRDLVSKIAALTGFHGNITWDTSKPNGQPRRCLDVSRAAEKFGFVATTSLDEGLRRTLAWYAANCRSLTAT